MNNATAEDFQENGKHSGLGQLVAEGEAFISIDSSKLQDSGFYAHTVYVGEDVSWDEGTEVATFATYTECLSYIQNTVINQVF